MKLEENYTLVFGLSADPVHQQHIDLVGDAADRLIDMGIHIMKILIIPVYRRNPVGEKQNETPDVSYEKRFEMCQLGAQEITRQLNGFEGTIEVSRIEQQLAQTTGRLNYTVETIQTLQGREDSKMNWILLLGSDLVSGDDPELKHWRHPEKLIQIAVIAIYPRLGYPVNSAYLKELERNGAHIIHLQSAGQNDMNSSLIRRRLQDGDEPLQLSREGLLPESVALYIKNENLYRLAA
jgi:nicotinate (nicotinamide) nucleotide adenylyltransferase